MFPENLVQATFQQIETEYVKGYKNAICHDHSNRFTITIYSF